MPEEIKSVIIQLQDTVENVHISGDQTVPLIIFPLASLIILRTDDKQVIENIIEKGIFIAAFRLRFVFIILLSSIT